MSEIAYLDRLATRLWLNTANVAIGESAGTLDRARTLAGFGFAPLDALHLAFAEASAGTLVVEVVMPDRLTLETEGDQP